MSAMKPPEPRRRGSVRRMGTGLQVRVSAGGDPVTGERIILVETVPVEKPGNERSERAAAVEAERVRTRLHPRKRGAEVLTSIRDPRLYFQPIHDGRL